MPHSDELDAGNVLAVENLNIAFMQDQQKIAAVRNLSFSLQRGETLAIVGESGSGKSVTALALMRLLEQAGGLVQCDKMLLRRRSRDVIELSEQSAAQMRHVRGADMAMIFQEPMTSLNPVFTVGEQIAESIRLHQNASREEAMVEAKRMLDQVRIPEAQTILSRYSHQLSGGMRQRVMIAMALSCRPAVLIADEPTTALDVTIQAQILQLIKVLQKEMSMGVIFITHDMGVVAEIADRVLVMYQGEAVETGTVEQIFHAPQHPYTRALLAAVPQLGAMKGLDYPRRFPLISLEHPAKLYYPGGNLLNASDKLFYLPFAFIIIVLLVVYFMTTRVFRRQFSEMTELVNTLAFLPDSTDQIEALKIREGDAKEIISIKNSIAEMKDAEIERSNKLLSLISYDQESGFIKNMAIIESNNNQYLAVGIIKLCGLEAVEAVFGVDERNKIVRKLCQRIAEKYAQCCDIVTFNADLYLLLCRENVQTFTRKIAMVNDFDSSFGYRNLRIHKSAICEPLQGENAWSYAEKLKLAISSIRDHMFSEFIFCDDAKLNEIEENIWIARNIRHAMEIGELFLVYQPIVDINTRAILSAEALCRWVSAERGIISPLKFITIAEDIGFINELGYQIIKTAMG